MGDGSSALAVRYAGGQIGSERLICGRLLRFYSVIRHRSADGRRLLFRRSVLRRRTILHILREQIRDTSQRDRTVHQGALLRHLEDRVRQRGYIVILDLAGLLTFDLLGTDIPLCAAAALLLETEPAAAVLGLAGDDRLLGALRALPVRLPPAVAPLAGVCGPV